MFIQREDLHDYNLMDDTCKTIHLTGKRKTKEYFEIIETIIVSGVSYKPHETQF